MGWHGKFDDRLGVLGLHSNYRGGLFGMAGEEVTPTAAVLEGSVDACTVLLRLARSSIFLRRAASLVRMLCTTG